MGGEGLGGIHRIEVDQTALVRIIDIQRNGKGEGKLAASYAIGALIQGLGSVFVFESLLSAILVGIVQSTGNRLLGISYGSGDDAPEVVCSLDMTCHAGDRACLQHRQGCGSGNRDAVDGIYYYLTHRQIERKSRVAQEGIMEMVFGDIGTGSWTVATYQVVLSQSVRFAHRDRLAVYQTEHSVDEGAVDILVIQGGNGTGGAIEGYCAAFIVEQRIFSDVGIEPVERHDIAGGGYPERQVGIAEIGKIGEFQNRFVRHLCRIAMSGIIHDEGSRSLLLLDDLGCLWIGIARRGGFAGIGIPHHLLD